MTKTRSYFSEVLKTSLWLPEKIEVTEMVTDDRDYTRFPCPDASTMARLFTGHQLDTELINSDLANLMTITNHGSASQLFLVPES